MSLAVVIPVFNEERTIIPLLKDLSKLLAHEDIKHEIIIINDGSSDNSLMLLEALSVAIPEMTVITQKNCGHGPSLLNGYQMALKYDWVFQLDSDYQYELSAFTQLWNNKEHYDLLVAERNQRNASAARDIATGVSQGLVKLLYGKGIRDINSPFRLMRTKKLALVLPHIKADSFAPNILITGWFLKKKFPFFISSALVMLNAGDRKSKMSLYIFKGCLKSFADALLFRLKI